jgi:UDP-2,4-diacetamido-2,4,6-trideoxy-beta-L-altropyranose hydrolase
LTGVVIRAEGSAAIGLGHLRRCVSIGQALAHLGAGWTLAAHDAAAAAAVAGGAHVAPIAGARWTLADAEEVAGLAAACSGQAVLVDSYEADDAYVRAISNRGHRVAILDDRPIARGCDLRINPSAGAEKSERDAERPYLGGPSFVPLRPEFWSASPRTVSAVTSRVLITLGGGDPRRLSERLFSGVLACLPDVDVTCVAGPFFDHVDSLRAIAGATSRASIVTAPTAVADLFRDADIAISGAGQTLYELAAVGTPAVAIAMADNQVPQLDALARAEIVIDGGRAADEQIVERVVAQISALAADRRRRSDMSRRGQELVDGQGALRVARALIAVAAGRGAGGVHP